MPKQNGRGKPDNWPWTPGAGFDNGAPWTYGEHSYLTGQAAIDQTDAVAIEMERKWGAGRLRLLVAPELAARFDAQRLKLNRANSNGSLDEVILEATRMANAWRALDRAANEAGAKCLSPLVWEVATQDGTVIAIVRGNEDAVAASVDPYGRQVAVFTLDEVANLLDPKLLRLKMSQGGEVVAVRNNIPDPLHGMPDDRLDDLPLMGG